DSLGHPKIQIFSNFSAENQPFIFFRIQKWRKQEPRFFQKAPRFFSKSASFFSKVAAFSAKPGTC
ncbi:MAG: hypothetical protein VZR28_11320, partial [Candidatus Cryptobacteroides sp.]|nr:hypothetical protein [Candidatus Cryptobacteroides sp.]